MKIPIPLVFLPSRKKLILELTYFQRTSLFKKFTWSQRVGNVAAKDQLQMAEMEAARPPLVEAPLQMAESWRWREEMENGEDDGGDGEWRRRRWRWRWRRRCRREETEKTTAERNDERERDDYRMRGTTRKREGRKR
uniref:Uncharacterized protein n=1 Tax=Solanum lycopersicum TaxID=4081 RepID=A0A3Q7FZ57_SOLLC